MGQSDAGSRTRTRIQLRRWEMEDSVQRWFTDQDCDSRDRRRSLMTSSACRDRIICYCELRIYLDRTRGDWRQTRTVLVTLTQFKCHLVLIYNDFDSFWLPALNIDCLLKNVFFTEFRVKKKVLDCILRTYFPLNWKFSSEPNISLKLVQCEMSRSEPPPLRSLPELPQCHVQFWGWGGSVPVGLSPTAPEPLIIFM